MHFTYFLYGYYTLILFFVITKLMSDMKLYLMTKTLSVRQTRRQSSCFHSGIGGLLSKGSPPVLCTVWATLLAIISLTSCSHPAEHDFHPSEEAISAYADFLRVVKNTENITACRLIEMAQQWYALDDSVISCIARDSIIPHVPAGQEIIHDSLRFYMGRLIDSRQWAFTDYLTIIKALNRVVVDTVSLPLIASAHRFYALLDSVPTYSKNAERTIGLYQKMLDQTLATGFRSKADIITFLRKEDMAFRSFLKHLPVYEDIPLDDITNQTGKVIRHIIDLSMKEPSLFHKEELVILLTVRNNRRLLQNALVCLDEIQRNRYIADSNRSTAYLWMLVQPWISFDELSYTLLSEQQTDALYRLAKETSKATKKLKHSGFPLEVDGLPALLIKAYITNINQYPI